MLFQHEAVRRSVQTSSEGPMKRTCVIAILTYITWFQPKPHWKGLLNITIYIFLHWISLNKMASGSNFWMSLFRHNVIDMRNVFAKKASAKWLVWATTLSHVTSCKQFRAQFRLCQDKNHVQTAHESHDLNMDFCSFDNGFKQLCNKFYARILIWSGILLFQAPASLLDALEQHLQSLEGKKGVQTTSTPK